MRSILFIKFNCLDEVTSNLLNNVQDKNIPTRICQANSIQQLYKKLINENTSVIIKNKRSDMMDNVFQNKIFLFLETIRNIFIRVMFF